MIKLNVQGMTCDHCQKTVKEALEGVPGIDKAEVDLENGTAVAHGAADLQVLVGVVENEGYTATIANT